MKTKDLLGIIFYSSGGVFFSPNILFGRENKRASAFRSFLRFNKSLFNAVTVEKCGTFYELNNKGCAVLFGVNEALFIKQSFAEMGIYERLLRSVMAVELAKIIPSNKKLININNINYSFFNETFSLPSKRANIICDSLSADIIGDEVGSFHVPKLLKNKNISRTLRSFLNYSILEINHTKDFPLKDSEVVIAGKNNLIKKSSVKTEDLVSTWRMLFDELIEKDDEDMSKFFSKKELLDMAIILNGSLLESDYLNTRDTGTNIKYHLLRLLSCEDYQAWDSLAREIKGRGASFFGKVGVGSIEEEANISKLKEVIEYALSDHSKSKELGVLVNALITKDAPFYSKRSFLSVIKNSLDKDFRKNEVGWYLIMQFKSSLILYFINHSTTIEKHSGAIEFIINNDLDIFNSVMLSFVMKNNAQ